MVVPPFINSLFSAIALLMERFRRGLLTHVTLLTLDSLNDLRRDVIGRYNSILLIDPPVVMRLNELANASMEKKTLIIGREGIDWVDTDAYLEFNESMPQLIWQLLNNELSQDSIRFLETAVIHEFSVTPDYNTSLFNGWLTTELINYPALPGILRLSLSISLSRAFSPVIPGITGNEKEAKNLVKAITKRTDATYKELNEGEVMALLKYIGDFMLRTGFRGDYLDKLVLMHRKWVNTDFDVLESILAVESQLVLWEYAGGLLNPVLNPQSIKTMDNLITRYMAIFGELVGQLDKDSIMVRQGYQPLTLIDRLCSIIGFKTESKNKIFLLENEETQLICAFNEDVTDAELVFKRGNYSIAVRGLRQ
ncbi:hypothetical protein [Vulcanisaeta sp. JCM 16159]|uniref:hypothetical protein n=1 Tax=Vulcanisaeta sp. JCM 16159 TaxID=1295371 RepID=UPI001FB45B22|nr:hypothetical protein [Vulcanisaeta sp. JCM 16159]